jgi:hypothetical protein
LLLVRALTGALGRLAELAGRIGELFLRLVLQLVDDVKSPFL